MRRKIEIRDERMRGEGRMVERNERLKWYLQWIRRDGRDITEGWREIFEMNGSVFLEYDSIMHDFDIGSCIACRVRLCPIWCYTISTD